MVVAVAACTLAAVAAVGLVARAGDRRPSDEGDRTETGPSDPVAPAPAPHTDAGTNADANAGAIPDGLLVPGPVPEGLTLWSVEWSRGEVGISMPNNHQLFEADGGGRLLIDIDGMATLGGWSPGDAVTVRGVEGTVGPAKEFADRASTISWEEGISLHATFTGMALDEALALLDGLTWRSDVRLDGFDPPTGGGVTLVAEAPPGTAGGPALHGTFLYRDDPASVAPGAGRQLEVRTTTAAGSMGRELLLVMLYGEARDDGGVESFDPAFGTLSVAWPDGRRYWIDANATPLTEDELRAAADGISEATGPAVVAMRSEVAARVAATFDLVGEASLQSGDVRLREAGGSRVACLVPPGGDEICPGLAQVGPWDGDGPAVTSLDVDGTWVMAVVGPPGVTVRESRPEDDPMEQRPPLDAETATAGGLTYLLVRLPAEVASVLVMDPVTDSGAGWTRPTT